MANPVGRPPYVGYIVICEDGPMRIGPILEGEEFEVANESRYMGGILFLADECATLFPQDSQHGPRTAQRAIDRTKAYIKELKLQWPWLEEATVVPVRTNGTQDS